MPLIQTEYMMKGRLLRLWIGTLIVLIVAAGLGFAWYAKRSAAELADLSKTLELTQRELATTQRDLSNAQSELQATRSKVESLIGQLSGAQATSAELSKRVIEATDRAKAELAARDATASELQRSVAQLEAALKTTTESAQSNEAAKTKLAEFQRRHLAASAEVNDGVARAGERVRAAEDALMSAPSDAAFAEHAKKLAALRAQCEKARMAVESLAAFAEENQVDLASGRESVDETLRRSSAAKASLSKYLTRVDRCISSRRELRYDVLAEEGWQTSRLTLADGELVAITASGTWRWATIASDNAVGPEGENNSVTYRVAASLNNACLLLRVRGSEFVHPGWVSLRPERAGDVEFRINDDRLGDNRGSIQVRMWAFLPLGT